MEVKGPTPQTTLLILLGASEWPSSDQFQSSEVSAAKAFSNAAQGVRDYFCNPQPFGLPAENLLDLFDSEKGASELDLKIEQFLKQRLADMTARGSAGRDLLLYFIGHGGFAGDDHDYYLAIRSTGGNLLASGLGVKALAYTLKEEARHLRRIIILDCCFAAAARHAFQGAPDHVAFEKTKDAFRGGPKREGFPTKGTTLFCSSNHKSPSVLLPDYSSTMFTKAFLDALVQGTASQQDHLSLREMKEATWDLLSAMRDYTRPVVDSPDQSEGDVADIPFFPNPWFEKERLRRAKEEQARLVKDEKEQARLAEEERVRKIQEKEAIRKSEEKRSLTDRDLSLFRWRTEPSYEEQVRKAQEREEIARKEAETRREAEQEQMRKSQEKETARKAELERSRLPVPISIKCSLGHMNPAGSIFCDECGEPLIGAASVGTATARFVVCPSCEGLNPEGKTFCSNCGSAIAEVPLFEEEWDYTPQEHPIVQNYPSGKAEEEQTHPARNLTQLYRICHNCGASLTPDETYCPRCGTRYVEPIIQKPGEFEPFSPDQVNASTPRISFLESVGDFAGDVLGAIRVYIDDELGWGGFFFGLFDVLAISISLGLLQKNWWVFLVSLLCSIALFILGISAVSHIIGYMIIIIFAISWGIIGWSFGSLIMGVLQAPITDFAFGSQHLKITWGQGLAGALAVVGFSLSFFVHKYIFTEYGNMW